MGFVTGSVRLWLLAEGLVALAASAVLYHSRGGSWLLFAAFFFVPDLSMLAYLAGSRTGATAYNVAHSYVSPLAVLGMGFATKNHAAMPCALIWMAHIGFDRMLGYRLKYPEGFGNTHLGLIGKQKASAAANL
jgi:hypothetical protein